MSMFNLSRQLFHINFPDSTCSQSPECFSWWSLKIDVYLLFAVLNNGIVLPRITATFLIYLWWKNVFLINSYAITFYTRLDTLCNYFIFITTVISLNVNSSSPEAGLVWGNSNQISDRSCVKSQNLNVSSLVLQLCLPNPLKPGAKGMSSLWLLMAIYNHIID